MHSATTQIRTCSTTAPASYSSSIDIKAVVIANLLVPPVLSVRGRDCSKSDMLASTSVSLTLDERGDTISEFEMRWLKWVILEVTCKVSQSANVWE